MRGNNYYRSDSGQRTDFQVLEDLIRDTTGVAVTIKIRQLEVSIRSKDWADFYIAKSAIKGRVSQEIVRDIELFKA